VLALARHLIGHPKLLGGKSNLFEGSSQLANTRVSTLSLQDCQLVDVEGKFSKYGVREGRV
jgi:hypothetical protein